MPPGSAVMTQSPRVPVADGAGGALGQQARTRGDLSVRVSLAFGVVVALVAALTLLAVSQMEDGAAVAAVALGLAAVTATLAIATWLLRGLVRPIVPATLAALRISRGDLTVAMDDTAGGELQPLSAALHQYAKRCSTW